MLISFMISTRWHASGVAPHKVVFEVMRSRVGRVLMLILLCGLSIPVLASADAKEWLEGVQICALPTKALIHQRPRLYLTDQKLPVIRDSLAKEPMKRVWWALLKDAANDLKVRADKRISWQEMKMNTPDMIPRLAMVYLLTNDKRYLDHALLWIDAYVGYENWGDNQDLVAAHPLFALSVAYDWLYEELGNERRNKLKQKIAHHANSFYRMLRNDGIWWAHEYLQGHNYYNVMSLAVAGVSLYDECAEAEYWVAAAKKNFEEVATVLSPDGASHEGVGYWAAGTEALLSYVFGMQAIAPDRSLVESEFLRNTAMYRLYMAVPGYRENANYADSNNFEWNGPGTVLRALAALYKDPRPQWLADAVEKARSTRAQTWLDTPKYSWLDIVWYDDSVGRKSPQELPNYAYFSNLGLYVYRTDWSDSAAWLLYKAAPQQGWHAFEKGLIVRSHIHPDEGQVLYYANGKWLLRDDSYVTPKWTKNHNVIIVNGRGQLGEGERWFQGGVELNRKASVSLVHKQLDNNAQYIVTDNTIMYPKSAGLKRWLRSVITLKGNDSIIVDDIELNGKGTTSTLFHLDPTAYDVGNAIVCLDGRRNRYILKQLYPVLGEYRLSPYLINKIERHELDLGFYSGKLLEFTDDMIKPMRKVYLLADRSCDSAEANNVDWLLEGKKLGVTTASGRYEIDFDTYQINYAGAVQSQNQ